MCLWEVTSQLILQRKMSLDEFEVWCDEFPDAVSVVVVESYILRRNRANAQTGSKMQASQGIGIARAFARKKHAKLVTQAPDILRITALHAGIRLPQGHIPDDVSAFLHGFYWFETQGILKAKPPVL